MSCIVPKWNLRQEEAGEGEERKRSPHVQSHHNLTYVVPMSCENEVRELTWEKGQLGFSKPAHRWGGSGDHTLESIVHQAYYSSTSNSVGKWEEDEAAPPSQMQSGNCSKRMRSEPEAVEESVSASAAFCRDTDTTMMTWNSVESSRSLKSARLTNTNADHDDSVYHDFSENQDGEGTAKGESCRSQSSARRSRAAAIHNLSERRRRDRINEKMKALQKLVPNASKTDKASMLDEVIEYLKQLQAQVHMMSNARTMVMPLGMQQQLLMAMLARMGMGTGMNMGMGMGVGMGGGVLDVNNLTRNLPSSFPPLMHAPLGGTTPFVPPPFTMPPMVPPALSPSKPNFDAATISTDAYNTFLAQSMNMEFLNKMSALYKQQSNSQQPSKKPVGLSLPNDAHGG